MDHPHDYIEHILASDDENCYISFVVASPIPLTPNDYIRQIEIFLTQIKKDTKNIFNGTVSGGLH